MNIPIRYLRALVLGAELGSFTSAAKAMHITQSAYSLIIQNLEQRLGVHVFNRTTRKVALSEEGQELLPIAKRILSNLQEIKDRSIDMREGHRGTLKVAIVPSMACSILPSVLAIFRQNMPLVNIELYEAQALPLIEYVDQGGAELAICIRPEGKTSLHFEKLLLDPLVAIIKNDDPLAKQKCVSWRDLKHLSHISITTQSGVWAYTIAAATTAGVTLKPTLQTSSYFTAISLVRAGLGYTVISKLAMKGASLEGVTALDLIDPKVEREIGIITLKQGELSIIANKFVDALKQFCEQIA